MKSKISNILIILLSIIVISYIGLLIFGYQGYAVKTGSMHPDIPQGALAITKKLKADEVFDNISIDDDIVFRTSSGNILTHRVVKIDDASNLIQTQGIKDGASLDAPIKAQNVIGEVVFSIPLIGYIVILFQNIFFLIILIVIILIVIITKYLLKELRKNKTIK